MGRNGKIVLLVVIAISIVIFFAFDLDRFLTLEFIKNQQDAIEHYHSNQPVRTGMVFFLTYIIVTGLSLPGAGIMTLAGGAIFGILWGTILVSFASVIGASIAFLASRLLFREGIQRRFEIYLDTVNKGIARDGALYLFTMRLVPVFPFFIINLVMGLTAMKLLTFAWVSQVGMLPATIVFVNAGTQLAKIEELSDILSPELLASFALLGLFPLLTKKLVDFIRRRRQRPELTRTDDDSVQKTQEIR